VAFVSGTSAIIICYWLSQYFHHEKPFPDTWISATADHYPEYIVFRIGTISGAIFLMLSHVMSYFWLCQTAYDNAFNLRKYWPGIGTTLGMAGAMFLMGSTATLDTGKHNTNWHVMCAGSFFILSILAVWYYTIMSVVLYANAQAGGQISLGLKIAGSLLILLQVYLETKAKEERLFQHKLHDRLGNIL
jgi:hypothetical protein